MKDVSDEEINKTIAEFMERIWYAEYLDLKNKLKGSGELTIDHIKLTRLTCFYHDWRPYTTSLDSLIPVIEKLNVPMSFYYNTNEIEEEKYQAAIDASSKQCPTCERHSWEYGRGQDKSPSRALALACYHVIKEMEG